MDSSAEDQLSPRARSIGSRENGRVCPFRGTIDEVMVFNRALSAKEVLLLWKSP